MIASQTLCLLSYAKESCIDFIWTSLTNNSGKVVSINYLKPRLLGIAAFISVKVANKIKVLIHDCKSLLAVLHKSLISSAAGSARVKPAD